MTEMLEQGSRRTLREIRSALQDSFEGFIQCVEREEWIEDSTAAIKQIGAEAYFRRLLVELRAELGPLSV